MELSEKLTPKIDKFYHTAGKSHDRESLLGGRLPTACSPVTISHFDVHQCRVLKSCVDRVSAE